MAYFLENRPKTVTNTKTRGRLTANFWQVGFLQVNLLPVLTSLGKREAACRSVFYAFGACAFTQKSGFSALGLSVCKDEGRRKAQGTAAFERNNS
ncbi:hypothetical protein GU926_14470 [Nibribacter ruber]|uniref:Uncharacterized protein n=1 Tax=Nibribacter ruber TaxID=2698458 RepID=A0A6P1P2G0_9BACT|nr:hypothetical protein [Nibribacter ruber]QHL88570.1 hypothetical protein GU926_14470 [Nibribacter ruber]